LKLSLRFCCFVSLAGSALGARVFSAAALDFTSRMRFKSAPR
jgi:hypothetical protein